MQFIQLSLAVATLAGISSALGINCRGSGNCPGAIGNIQGVLASVESANQGRTYYDQQHIGCANNLCAFYQVILFDPITHSLQANDDPFRTAPAALLGMLRITSGT